MNVEKWHKATSTALCTRQIAGRFRHKKINALSSEATNEGALYGEGEPEFRWQPWRCPADKGAKAIKLATGWERGADGKWLYEVSDGTIKENPKYETVRDEVGIIGYKTTLGELINDELLFLSYPELRDYSWKSAVQKDGSTRNEVWSHAADDVRRVETKNCSKVAIM